MGILGLLSQLIGPKEDECSAYTNFCLEAERTCKRCPKCNELRHTSCDINGNWNKYAEKHEYRKCVKCGFIYSVSDRE